MIAILIYTAARIGAVSNPLRKRYSPQWQPVSTAVCRARVEPCPHTDSAEELGNET